MQIDFVSVLLFIGMGQCIFLLLAIALSEQKSRTANWFLFGLLLVFLWFQLEFFLLRHTLDVSVPFIYSTRYGAWLIVGPLILLFNRATLVEKTPIQSKTLFHFLPFLVFTVLLPFVFDDLITHRSIDYGMLTVFDAYNREPISTKHYLYGTIFILQFVHALIYLFLAYRETQIITGLAKEQESNLPFHKIESLKLLYLGAILIILLCSGFVIYQFATALWRRNLDYFYVLPTLFFVFGLAYRAMKYPNSILILREDPAKPKYERSTLQDSEKMASLKVLEEKMEVEKIYRNNELRLADLAEAVNLSTHHLSQILNEQKQQNFFDFINRYRVEEAKQQMLKARSRTLLEIAYEVGFNSKNSFNSAFKKYVGMTPSAYRKQH